MLIKCQIKRADCRNLSSTVSDRDGKCAADHEGSSAESAHPACNAIKAKVHALKMPHACPGTLKGWARYDVRFQYNL